jgi:hypothetical protein
MSMNTIEPSPIGEASDDGRLVLDLGHFPRARPLEGEPIIVVQDGEVIQRKPGARAADGRGDRRGGTAPADRAPGRGAVRDPRDERDDQLHQEGLVGDLGRRAPLVGFLPLRVWRIVQDRRAARR